MILRTFLRRAGSGSNGCWSSRGDLVMRIVALLVAIAGCAACGSPVDSEHTASTQQAITHGEDDDGDPAVVALLIGGKVFCTGVLVTPNVVATAAHCVDPTPPDQVFFGTKPNQKKGGTFIAVSDSKVHPDFQEDTLENDIALVGLASKAPVAPLQVFTADFDATYIGRAIRIVGFGATGFAEESDLRKRTGDTTITSYGDDDFRFHATPSQTCNGDSGGPALAKIDDREVIVGLASSGDQNCKQYGRHMRVDRYIPFIQSYTKKYSLAANPPDQNSGCSMTQHAPSSSGSSGAALLLVVACALAAWARRAMLGRQDERGSRHRVGDRR